VINSPGHRTTAGAPVEPHVRDRTAVLDRDALHRAAPSIFAARPWGEMSDRYGFVPTVDVVARLAGEGSRAFFILIAHGSNLRRLGLDPCPYPQHAFTNRVIGPRVERPGASSARRPSPARW
jgi:hypothetical protein